MSMSEINEKQELNLPLVYIQAKLKHLLKLF